MKEIERSNTNPIKSEPTLRESLVGSKGKLSKELTTVARMINFLDLSILEKRQLFFYHLWQDSLSMSSIKEFIEVREDPVGFIVDPVLRSDRLTQAYGEFYNRFEEKHRAKSKYQEREDEILPLRGKFTIADISQKTGYSQDYIKSVYKRALKKGVIEKLDKKDIVKINPQYSFYLRLRDRIKTLRNSDSNRYSTREISNSLSEEFDIQVTEQQVKRQIRMLLRDESIVKRVNQVK